MKIHDRDIGISIHHKLYEGTNAHTISIFPLIAGTGMSAAGSFSMENGIRCDVDEVWGTSARGNNRMSQPLNDLPEI